MTETDKDYGGSEIDDDDDVSFSAQEVDDALAYYERDPGGNLYDDDEDEEEDSFEDDDDVMEERLFPDEEALTPVPQQHHRLSGGRPSEEFCELPADSERRRLSSTSAASSVYRTDAFSPDGESAAAAAAAGLSGRRLDKVAAVRGDPRMMMAGRGRRRNVLYPPERPHPFVDFLTVFTAFMVAVVAAYYSIP